MAIKKDRTEHTIPNFTICSWMISVLKLSKAELLLFAYLFDQTYDGKHKCFTSLDVMGIFFDCARQSVARNIDKLVEKSFVKRETTNDPINPIIRHNSYYVNIDNIAQLCIDAGYSEYESFIKTYEISLKALHPDNEDAINEVIDHMQSLSGTQDDENITLNVSDLKKIIHLASGEYSGKLNIEEEIEKIIASSGKLKKHNKRSYTKPVVEKAPTQEPSVNSLFNKPKRSSTKAQKEKDLADKIAMNNEFVIYAANGSQKLLDMLNQFLKTTWGEKCKPFQWKHQLDILYEGAISEERMIDSVRNAIAGSYHKLYVQDKSEVDMKEKLHIIREYVDEEADGNEKLYDLLLSFVTKTQRGKACNSEQLNMLLDELSDICETTKDKIESVSYCYKHGYAALAYRNSNDGGFAGKSSFSDPINKCVEQDDKLKAIDDFIADGYYYLVEGLKEALIKYATETKVGRSMSISDFKSNLNDLRLFGPVDSELVDKVNQAISNNYRRLAVEDYEHTNTLKTSGSSREALAKSKERRRKSDVMDEIKKHPDNPLIKNVVI